jgi:hypothetical protein
MNQHLRTRFFYAIGIALTGLAILAEDLHAQPLSAYVNLQNQVMIWDNGIVRKMDYLPPTSMQVGRSAVAYLDNSRSFKIYYNGGIKTLNLGYTNTFQVTDNLVTFRNAQSLNVFDRGTVKNLSNMCTEYYVGDSVILYFDGIHSVYNAYYNGNIYPIENFLAGTALNSTQVGANIVAYDNYAGQFRIFYQGEIIAQEEYQVTPFSVGRNTVAYVDINRQFKIFTNGATHLVEQFQPVSFKAGDNLVAFVSNDGYFKISYQDSIYSIGYFRPDYNVVDNIVTFQDPSGYFKVFYKGEIYTLESFYPTAMQVRYNSVAYINQTNTLRLFSAGEIYDVTNADVADWQLYYDVLQYRIGQNIYRIFYKGEEY